MSDFAAYCTSHHVLLRYWLKQNDLETEECEFGYIAAYIPLGDTDGLVAFQEPLGTPYVEFYRLSDLLIAYADQDQQEIPFSDLPDAENCDN